MEEEIKDRYLLNGYSTDDTYRLSIEDNKRYTINKIQRMLLHILVGFTKEDAKNMKDITYIRLLGFSLLPPILCNKCPIS